jgi:hypothetical protein
MPFTISHTIVAFPIKRWFQRLPLDALIIGTTGPDLEYLYNLRVHGKYWHTFEGLLIGALPVCLVLVFLWRKAVYQAMLALLPQLREQGKVPCRLRSPIGYTILAVILGGLTHVFWDGFTHYDGWAVELWPQVLLRRTPVMPSYGWLQELSSLTGALILTIKLRKAWKEYLTPLQSVDRKRLIAVASLVVLLSAIGGVINAIRWHDQIWGIVLGQFLIGAMAAGVVIIAILSAIILSVRWYSYQRTSERTT